MNHGGDVSKPDVATKLIGQRRFHTFRCYKS